MDSGKLTLQRHGQQPIPTIRRADHAPDPVGLHADFGPAGGYYKLSAVDRNVITRAVVLN